MRSRPDARLRVVVLAAAAAAAVACRGRRAAAGTPRAGGSAGRLPATGGDRAGARDRQEPIRTWRPSARSRRSQLEGLDKRNHDRASPGGSRWIAGPVRWLERVGAVPYLGRGASTLVDPGSCTSSASCGAVLRATQADVLRCADARARSGHPAGDAAADIGARGARAMGSRRASRGAGAALSRPAVAAGARPPRADSRFEHRRRLPRAGLRAIWPRRRREYASDLLRVWQRAVYGREDSDAASRATTCARVRAGARSLLRRATRGRRRMKRVNADRRVLVGIVCWPRSSTGSRATRTGRT